MKRAGISTAIIREIMGHSSERVTQIYLDSFDNEQVDNLWNLSNHSNSPTYHIDRWDYFINFTVKIQHERTWFSKYNTAIIIGNGFDINLGLPTGYEDFIVSPQFERLINNDNQLAIHLKNSYALKNWIDIEKELALYSLDGATDNSKKNMRIYHQVLLIILMILTILKWKVVVQPMI